MSLCCEVGDGSEDGPGSGEEDKEKRTPVKAAAFADVFMEISLTLRVSML